MFPSISLSRSLFDGAALGGALRADGNKAAGAHLDP
jgi:hypothetical protein